MVWDKQQNELSAWDLKVLGCSEGRVPVVRLDVALPFRPEELHSLAHRFAGLSEELHTMARLPGTPRSKIHDAMLQLRHLRDVLKSMGTAWEHELQDRESGSSENQEHSEAAGGTVLRGNFR